MLCYAMRCYALCYALCYAMLGGTAGYLAQRKSGNNENVLYRGAKKDD